MREAVLSDDNWVRTFYERLIAGDIPTVENYLADDFVFHEAPNLPYGGDYRGKDGLLEVLGALGNVLQSPNVGPLTIALAEDRAITMFTIRATAASTGEQIDVPICEVIMVKGGKIQSITPYYFNPDPVLQAADR